MQIRPEALLTWVRDEQVPDLTEQLSWFSRLVLVHMAVTDWATHLRRPGDVPLVLVVGFTLTLALSFVPRLGRASMIAAFGLAAYKYAWLFPNASNHFHVEVLCLFFLGFVGLASQRERETVQSALRWLVVWLFLYSGLQKFLWGTYFHGQSFAVQMHNERFADFFQMILPRAEFEALRALPTATPGVIYEMEFLPALLLSNSIYLAEFAIGVLLLIPRLRTLGFALALGSIVAIEFVAREMMFGALALNLIVLYGGAVWTRVSCGVAMVIYAYVLAVRTGFVGGWVN